MSSVKIIYVHDYQSYSWISRNPVTRYKVPYQLSYEEGVEAYSSMMPYVHFAIDALIATSKSRYIHSKDSLAIQPDSGKELSVLTGLVLKGARSTTWKLLIRKVRTSHDWLTAGIVHNGIMRENT